MKRLKYIIFSQVREKTLYLQIQANHYFHFRETFICFQVFMQHCTLFYLKFKNSFFRILINKMIFKIILRESILNILKINLNWFKEIFQLKILIQLSIVLLMIEINLFLLDKSWRNKIRKHLIQDKLKI